MANFAELDSNNVVLRVIVVSNEALEHKEFPDSEAHALQYLHQWYGPETIWKQTSFSSRFRGNFAGIGAKYYPEHDIFMHPAPYPSWMIDTATAKWVAPVPKPDCKQYKWNEEAVAWDYIPPPPQPFPSWTLDPCEVWQPPVPQPTVPPPAGSIYVWQEENQKWGILELPDPKDLPPKPEESLPEGKIYSFNLQKKEWVVRDAPKLPTPNV
jgi:hypothetical protein